jgi:small membrane protein
VSVFQIAFTLFFVLQAAIALRRFARGHHVGSLAFAAMWLAAIVVVLNPGWSTEVARLVGIGRGVDLVTYALLSLFLWAHYQQYLRYKRLENQVTALVREIAIANVSRPAPVAALRPPGA